MSDREKELVRLLWLVVQKQRRERKARWDHEAAEKGYIYGWHFGEAAVDVLRSTLAAAGKRLRHDEHMTDAAVEDAEYFLQQDNPPMEAVT